MLCLRNISQLAGWCLVIASTPVFASYENLSLFFTGGKEKLFPKEIFVVHGSLATTQSWHQPGGDFYQALERSAEEAFADTGFVITPFLWDGGLLTQSRLIAAENLALLMIKNSEMPKITIGHSHGGNVINLASQILEMVFACLTPHELEERIKKLTSHLYQQIEFDANGMMHELSTYNQQLQPGELKKEAKECLRKIQMQYAEKIKQNRPSQGEMLKALMSDLLVRLRNKWASRTIIPPFQELSEKQIEQYLYASVEKISSLVQQNATSSRSSIQSYCPYILHNFLLGTPVDEKAYKPQPLMIGHTYSLYSMGDYIQSLLGAYAKKYTSPKSGCTNLRTLFISSNSPDEKPTLKQPLHYQLHASCIGSILLSLPELVNYVDPGFMSLYTSLTIDQSGSRNPVIEVLSDNEAKHESLDWGYLWSNLCDVLQLETSEG